MTLETGDVFLIRDFSHTGFDPHYQIVVHKTPSGDLVIVYPTTNLEKAKKSCFRDENIIPTKSNPDTYVEIVKGSCPALTKPCAINCNKAFLKNEKDCINGFDFSKKSGKIDEETIKKIREGIENSPVVNEFIIDALRCGSSD